MDKLTEIISVRLAPEESYQLKLVARREDIPVSRLVRLYILNEIFFKKACQRRRESDERDSNKNQS